MKKNLMKSAAIGPSCFRWLHVTAKHLLAGLPVAQRRAKDNAPNSAETTARMNVTTMLTVKIIKK